MTVRVIAQVRRILALLAGTVCAVASAADPASPSASARQVLAGYLLGVERGSAEWRTLIAEGQARAEFCVRCHGQDGISKTPQVPNLAGQNPYYLLDQIERFADNRRKDFIMSPLARQYNGNAKATVSLFFSSMPARAQGADPVTVAGGATLYRERCVACHGPDAHGSDLHARLAGQHPAYLKIRLRAFQQQGGQPPSPMTEMVRNLSDTQIDQLSVYLSSLP